MLHVTMLHGKNKFTIRDMRLITPISSQSFIHISLFDEDRCVSGTSVVTHLGFQVERVQHLRWRVEGGGWIVVEGVLWWRVGG